MNRIFLSVLLFLITSQCFSQQNFQPGYIITAKGDSIIGFINDQDWVITPLEVSFKKSLNVPAQLFKPVDLKRFHTSKSFYESAEVSFEKELIQKGSEPEMEKGIFFLETLVVGKPSLYYFKGVNEKIHFFLIKMVKYRN